MRPIFEQPPLRLRPPGRSVEQPAIISTQPRESGQIMRSRKDINAVDLVERKPLDCSAQMPLIDRGGPRGAEPLSGKRDPARGGERKPLRQSLLTRR